MCLLMTMVIDTPLHCPCPQVLADCTIFSIIYTWNGWPLQACDYPCTCIYYNCCTTDDSVHNVVVFMPYTFTVHTCTAVTVRWWVKYMYIHVDVHVTCGEGNRLIKDSPLGIQLYSEFSPPPSSRPFLLGRSWIGPQWFRISLHIWK